jgi:hypothetical protein
MKHSCSGLCASLLFFLGVTLGSSAADEGKVDFQRQIRPILSDACFQCHGPDAKARMAGLRLDLREAAFQSRTSGVLIAPGDSNNSLIYQRITDEDASRRMPPKYSHKELLSDQIDLIRRWIDEGASWEEHWAFTPLERPQQPSLQRKEWVRNPIDDFVLSRLEAEGLQPAPEADRRTLARRVSLDITGLPPSPDQVEAFLSDDSEDAYDTLVDRLMASPAYGEHRARYWLDVARYADTHGLHIDNYREIWPYRDWVIDAFNRNLPFDQFTIEQIGGDLLPNPTEDQIIATGFHRCNITTNEGGVIADEVRAMYAKERVDTTGTVWLGLTVGCATCHDHKFDPISQRDFYSLAAFFRNTTQHPLDKNIFDTPPFVVVPDRGDRERWRELRDAVPAARRRTADNEAKATRDFEEWLRSASRQSIETDRFDESETLSFRSSRSPEMRIGRAVVSLELPPGASITTQEETPFLALAEKAFLEIPGFKGLSGDKPFTILSKIRLRGEQTNSVILSQFDSEEQQGWVWDQRGGQPQISLSVQDGRSIGIAGSGERKLKPDQWHHVAVTYDGLRQRAGFTMYLDGQILATQSIGRATRTLQGSIQSDTPLLVGTRDREGGRNAGNFEGAIQDLRVFDRALAESEVRLLAMWGPVVSSEGKSAADLSKEEREALKLYYLVRHHADFREAAAELETLLKERRAILRRSAVTHVQEEKRDSDPMAHVLFRGMYDQPKDQVPPAIPAVLPPMPDSFPRNRLGLARWLVHDSNPLTARVTVNRFWQEVFGTGLVATAGDFGSQGEAPSHQELLDWLAVEFRDSGWDIKHLFRLMLRSATYRQSAVSTEAKLELDAGNRLLSRGPRFRLDGEVVRDYALAASGLLVSKIGGPSVKPYQPDGVWEAVAMDGSNTRFYKQDSGEKLYRRSLYTFWKRSAPPPTMTIFNAPSREECTVQRERTNTPLQALLTMNGPQFFEAARHLAQRAIHSGSSLERRLNFLASHLLSRHLRAKEQEIVRRAYHDYSAFYQENPAQLGRALAVGDSEPDGSLPRVEFAALTMVANQLMNLDEVLNK